MVNFPIKYILVYYMFYFDISYYFFTNKIVQILKYDDLMMYTYTFVTTSLDFVMVSSSTVGESNLLFRCKTSRKKNPIFILQL
jgi:hypothetical protein